MTYAVLPLSGENRQVFTLDLSPDGEAFHAQIELRFLPAANTWFFSLWDHSTGEQLANMVPLACSRGEVNDLLLPFRHLRGGRGAGSLLCLRAVDEPSTENPAEGNLQEFQLLYSDIFDDRW